jgi:tetratricopeptide (TPR) repeat protein
MKGAFDKLAEIRPSLSARPEPASRGDELLSASDLVRVHRRVAENRLRAVRAELAELFREKQWQQVLDLFSPVEEKLPALTDAGLDAEVREKLAFALGQLGRYDDAIAQLLVCAARTPENFHVHNALAYTAYNSLFAAKNREILLSGKMRAERIALAHTHFEHARRLRPDGVTNYYRHGMLWHKIEDKSAKALPLFRRAAANWEKLSTEEGERRHQEHKNYVKALYQAAGILLSDGALRQAAETLKRCLVEDEKTEHLSRLHKYFALGKIEYHAGRFQQARDALLFAEKCRGREPIDFVFELLARVYLGMNSPDKAMTAIERVPVQHRRPYYRWTEAEVLCALDRYDQAKTVLAACNERDRRSRHKGLIRLCKIEYLLGEYDRVVTHAREADCFFRERWTNACADALFWAAAGAFRAGNREQAAHAAKELRAFQPGYPKLGRLMALIGENDDAHGSQD